MPLIMVTEGTTTEDAALLRITENTEEKPKIDINQMKTAEVEPQPDFNIGEDKDPKATEDLPPKEDSRSPEEKMRIMKGGFISARSITLMMLILKMIPITELSMLQTLQIWQ